MQVITNNASLEHAIRQLESRHVMQTEDLRLQWEKAKEELSPGNIIKEGIRHTMDTPDFKETLTKAAVSFATGLVTKKALLGGTSGIIASLLGTIVQTGVTGLTFKNAEPIKSKGAALISGFLKKIRLSE